MFKLKLFSIAFFLIFILTDGLCILLGHPLIFMPINYGVGGFIEFGLLTGFLSFCLVYITLPFIRFIYRILKLKSTEIPFFIIGAFLVLQVVTLLTGYLESKYSIPQGDPFYYYKGIGNSLIYVLTGNLTAILSALLYAREQMRIKKISEPHFDFESDKNFR